MCLVVFRFASCMQWSNSFSHRRSMHCFDNPADLLYMLGLVVESLLFGLFTSCMMIDQWDVVTNNVTHIDRLKGDSGGDRLAGWTEVFGFVRGNVTFQSFDWLSPFGSVFFPSGLQEEIMGFCRPCSKANDNLNIELGIPVAMASKANAQVI
jgi:hypothetical protein